MMAISPKADALPECISGVTGLLFKIPLEGLLGRVGISLAEVVMVGTVRHF